MNEMILLGAGASVEAGVPGAYDMSERILTSLRSNSQCKRPAHALSYVVGGLLFEAGKNNLNPLKPTINVEELFNAVQLLGSRDTLEAAPFIGSWDKFINDLDRAEAPRRSGRLQRMIYDAVAKEILNAFSQSPPSLASSKIDKSLASNVIKIIEAKAKGRMPSTGTDGLGKTIESYLKELTGKWSSKLKSPSVRGEDRIEGQIEKQISASQPRPGGGRIFRETNDRMIAALKELAWIENPSKVSYLSPLINLLRQQKRLVVATLNYDNSIELLSASHRTICSTGIDTWSTHGRFDTSQEGLHLLKLHGSIDWLRDNGNSSLKQMPMTRIRQLQPEEVKHPDFPPAVIFGNRNKLTAEGPFLDLLRAFQDNLAQSQILTVIGYSFRDPHVNVYISQWMNTDSTRILRVVNGADYKALRYASNAPEYVSNLIDFSEQRPGRIEFIDLYAGEGLKKIYESIDATIPLNETPM